MGWGKREGNDDAEEGLIFVPPSRIMRMHQLLNECMRGGDLRSRSGGEERRDDGGALYQFASSGSNSVIDVFHEVRKDGGCRLFHYEVWSMVLESQRSPNRVMFYGNGSISITTRVRSMLLV